MYVLCLVMFNCPSFIFHFFRCVCVLDKRGLCALQNKFIIIFTSYEIFTTDTMHIKLLKPVNSIRYVLESLMVNWMECLSISLVLAMIPIWIYTLFSIYQIALVYRAGRLLFDILTLCGLLFEQFNHVLHILIIFICQYLDMHIFANDTYLSIVI